MKEGTLDMFPSVKEMIPIIVEHLTYLGRRAEDYFPSISVDEFDWIRSPLVKLRDSSNFAMCEEKESTSFSSDRGLRMNHAELPLDAFWFFIMQEQGRSQDFSKGGAEVMEAKALKKKNCL